MTRNPLPDPWVRPAHSAATTAAPGTGGLVDTHGRVATDLRVSLTDRCNLRCTYCMPPEGLAWLPKQEILTDEEINRLVRIGVEQLGIREVRFTGGEPLLRPGLVGLVAATASLDPRPEVSLTTNAIGLARVAPALAAAGLDRINVSLDTLDRDRFKQLAYRDRLDDVIAGLAAARDAGLTPVKVNAVLLHGINDHDAVPLLDFCLEHGYQLRFIEQMPLDAHHAWTRGRMVTAEDILEQLSSAYTLTPDTEPRGAPALAGRAAPSGPPAHSSVASSSAGAAGVRGTSTRCPSCTGLRPRFV